MYFIIDAANDIKKTNRDALVDWSTEALIFADSEEEAVDTYQEYVEERRSVSMYQGVKCVIPWSDLISANCECVRDDIYDTSGPCDHCRQEYEDENGI